MTQTVVDFILSAMGYFGCVSGATVIVFYAWGMYMRYRWRQGLWYRAGYILSLSLKGAADEYFLTANTMTGEGQIIGWIEMVNVYHNYITALPLHTRLEIIDKLLNNQQLRYLDREGEQCTDLVALLGRMNTVELETIVFAMGRRNIVDENNRVFASRSASELANDLIAFRFSNPY